MFIYVILTVILFILPYPFFTTVLVGDIIMRLLITVFFYAIYKNSNKYQVKKVQPIEEIKVVDVKVIEEPLPVNNKFKIDFSKFSKRAFQVDTNAYIKNVTNKIVQYALSKKITLRPTNKFQGLAVNEIHFTIEPNKKVVKGIEQIDIPTTANIEKLTPDIKRVIGGVEGVTFIPIIKGTSDIGFAIPSTKNNIASIRMAFESKEYESIAWKLNKLGQNLAMPILAGYNAKGNLITFDLTNAVHMIVAGTTGFGKSTQLNSIIAGLLAVHGPDTLNFAMIDIKKVELNQYANLPHLYSPIVQDTVGAAELLGKLTKEMDRRYTILKSVNVKKLSEFNKKIKKPEMFLPPIVVVVDEVAELLMDNRKLNDDNQTLSAIIMDNLIRLAQLGRAAGIHLILATQRPSAEVLDGRLRANIPTRMAFKTVTAMDSKIILDDSMEAANLVRQGDGLLKLVSESGIERFQGVIAEDNELASIIKQSGG